jgi:WD40 repeat protein
VKIETLESGKSDGDYVEAAGFLGQTAYFARASGIVSYSGDSQTEVRLHDGLLAAISTPDGRFLISTGEDERLIKSAADASAAVLVERPGWWMDRIAVGPGNAIAVSAGKRALVMRDSSLVREITSERSIEGLAFAPKGLRLAFARYNGVELHWMSRETEPVFLEWKGAHLSVAFSPDGRFLVTTMQENALHGWRLADGKNMRMSGYPAKVKSLSFSHKGKWLASSGAPAAIVWPFSGKDGPMGKAPKELGSMGSVMVTRVACHPGEQVVAIGYENGMIAAVKIDDGQIAMLRQEDRSELTALGWDSDGKLLAFGCANGKAGIVDLAG